MRKTIALLGAVLLVMSVTLPSVFAAAKTGGKGSLSSERPAVCLWNYSHMLEIRAELNKKGGGSAYEASLKELIAAAEKKLKDKPVAITDKPDECTAPTGDKRDFVSVGNYSWPNPDTPDGMPWIRKDGYVNPNAKRYDYMKRWLVMTSAVSDLGLAYFYTGDERYAQRAAEYASIWFMDPDTRMNPNMTYAAFLPGHNDNKGYYYGLIQGYPLKDCLAGLCLIKGSKAYTKEIEAAAKQWVTEFYTWFTTSDMGKQEKAMKNNHSTAYYMQTMSYALFIGDVEAAKGIVQEVKDNVIAKQIEPDGSQPRELARPFGYDYTILNLSHLVEMCIMMKDIDPDMFTYTTPDRRSISKGLDFAFRYLGKSVEDFAPYKQTRSWEASQRRALWCAAEAAVVDSSGHYHELFDANRGLDSADNIKYLKY